MVKIFQCRYIILVIFLFSFMVSKAQSTWFKIIPGWSANKCFVLNDTITSMGNGSNDNPPFDRYALFNSLDFNGNLLKSDTLNYKAEAMDSLVVSTHWRAGVQPLVLDNKIVIPITVSEKAKEEYKWRNQFFEYPSLKKLPININFDTSESGVNYSSIINKQNYLILYSGVSIGDNINRPYYFLYKILPDTQIIIKSHLNTQFIPSYSGSHIYRYYKVIGDTISTNHLFLMVGDEWDMGDSYQGIIQKIDSNGKILWGSRPLTDTDSFNTANFQMIQKPNGNILCSWLDMTYRPYKNPGWPSQIAQGNDYGTIWFAELDYQTGQVLWKKNIREYLKEHFLPVSKEEDERTYHYVFFYDVQLTNNGIVWAGSRRGAHPLIAYKDFPLLLKTDFDANPIWYREYDLYPNDTGDNGMQVYSFTQMPDKGFLLTGEYRNRGGQISNGEFWQKAALLKLDSNGCLVPGCEINSSINGINETEYLCKIYPNPTKGELHIGYPSSFYNYEITLMDITGKLLHKWDNSVNTIDTKEYANGIYILQIKTHNQHQYETHKIIIQH